MANEMGRFGVSEPTADMFRMISATADMFAALGDLVICFDADGGFSLPDDLNLRLDNARKAIQKAVPPEAYERWMTDNAL